MEKEVVTINGEKIEVYYFDNPMFHEDWHRAEDLGLKYVQYNHYGPDYWDDTLIFTAEENFEIVKEYFKKSW